MYDRWIPRSYEEISINVVAETVAEIVAGVRTTKHNNNFQESEYLDTVRKSFSKNWACKNQNIAETNQVTQILQNFQAEEVHSKQHVITVCLLIAFCATFSE